MFYVEPKNSHLNPKYNCVFCASKKHSSHLCRKYTKNELFYHVVVKEYRCKNCLRQFHRSDRCFEDSYCVLEGCHRKDKHSPTVCRRRFLHKNDAQKSIWSELYAQHKKDKYAQRTSIWSELYKENILMKTQKKNPDVLSQYDDSSMSTHSLAVIASKSKNCSSHGTQTDEEDFRSSSHLSQDGIHSSEESQLSSSSSLFVPCQEKTSHNRFIDYLKVPCSIHCFCKVKNSVRLSTESKISSFQIVPHKDFFMNILVWFNAEAVSIVLFCFLSGFSSHILAAN